MLATEVALTEAQRKRCIRVFCLFCFCTAVSAQTFMTSLPLLITDEHGLHQEVVMSGVVQTVMVVGAIISYVSLTPLLARFTPRSLAIASQLIRICSASVFAVVVCFIRDRPWTLGVIIATRFVFGLSMGAAGLPAIWIAHRFGAKDRPRAVATYSAALGCGMILGPVAGSVLQTASSDVLTSSSMPGWASVGTSTLLIVLMQSCFSDTQLLPRAQSGSEAPKVQPHTRRTLFVIILITFLVLFGAMALEGTVRRATPFKLGTHKPPAQHGFVHLRHADDSPPPPNLAPPSPWPPICQVPIIIERAYGWKENEQYRLFIPLGIGTLLGAIVMIDAQERFNWSILSLTMTCGYIVGFYLAINLLDLSRPVHSTRFVIGIVIMLVAGSTSFTLHSSLLSVKAPPHLISALFSIQAALGQLGRSIGPLATSGIYQLVDDKLTRSTNSTASGMGYATNCTAMSTPVLSLIASSIGLVYWRSVYGGLCDPSLRSIKRVQDQAAAVLAHVEEADGTHTRSIN